MKSFDPCDPYAGHNGTPSPPSREENEELDRIARQREVYFAEQPETGEDGQ